MKITANKRDDIIRRRDEFDADRKARDAKYEQQLSNYRRAAGDVFAGIKEKILAELSGFKTLELNVLVDNYFGEGIQVRIQSNEYGKHADAALRWTWSGHINTDGEVVKETNSWSGLSACTAAQLDSLQESVDALRIINNMDWETILKTPTPKVDEYVEYDPERRKQRPNFERELIEADIEECIGQPVLVRGVAGETSGYRTGADVYYHIEGQSPKQYTVSEIHPSQYDRYAGEGLSIEEIINNKMHSTYRISKDKLVNLVGNEVKTIS